MKIQAMSDLHLEFLEDPRYGRTAEEFVEELPVEAGTLVIAGDLCLEPLLETHLTHLCKRWDNVVFVYGNHELYNSSFQDVIYTLSHLNESIPNLHVLNNSVVELEGQRFVGTAMWFPWLRKNQTFEYCLSDFKLIQGFVPRVYEENEKATGFLKDTVKEEDVVITHHIPHKRGIDKEYRNSNLNRFFLCDMRELILKSRPKLWLFGHTHKSCDFREGATRLLANTAGYPFENWTRFRKDLTIDL